MNQPDIQRQLQYNAQRYRSIRRDGKAYCIESISLELTHACICKCRMCNIWRTPPDKDLPAEHWKNLLASKDMHSLREIDITGGEPFLYPELEDLLTWIFRHAPYQFPALKTIAITTNAILTSRILDIMNALLPQAQNQSIDIVLACGIDAVGERHDQIRGTPNAWKHVNRTMQGLLELRSQFPNLILGIKTTIIPENLDALDDIEAYARRHHLFGIISPRIITGNRFDNISLQTELEFSPDDLTQMQSFFNRTLLPWDIHRQTVLETIQSKAGNKPCSAGMNSVFIKHGGHVYSCPLLEEPLGDSLQTSLSDILDSERARSFRKGTGTHRQCQRCTEPGIERLSYAFEGSRCLEDLERIGMDACRARLEDMGLFKYLQT